MSRRSHRSADGSAGIAAGVTLEILQFAAAIIVAGVLLAYAETLTGVVRGLADRVADARGRRFLDIAGSTIRNVSQGVIGIALLQSALLGIGMLVAGVPFAGALTFACLVLAIVQVGPNIVMIPVIIWAWFSLPTLTAAILHRLHGALAAGRQRAAADRDGARPADADGRHPGGRDLRDLGRRADRPVHRAGRARRPLRARDGLDRGRTAGERDRHSEEPRPRAAGGVRSGHGPLRFVRRSAVCRRVVAEFRCRVTHACRVESSGPSLPPQCPSKRAGRPLRWTIKTATSDLLRWGRATGVDARCFRFGRIASHCSSVQSSIDCVLAPPPPDCILPPSITTASPLM